MGEESNNKLVNRSTIIFSFLFRRIRSQTQELKQQNTAQAVEMEAQAVEEVEVEEEEKKINKKTKKPKHTNNLLFNEDNSNSQVLIPGLLLSTNQEINNIEIENNNIENTPTYWSNPATPGNITNDINVEVMSPPLNTSQMACSDELVKAELNKIIMISSNNCYGSSGVTSMVISDERKRLPLLHTLRLNGQTGNNCCCPLHFQTPNPKEEGKTNKLEEEEEEEEEEKKKQH